MVLVARMVSTVVIHVLIVDQIFFFVHLVASAAETVALVARAVIRELDRVVMAATAVRALTARTTRVAAAAALPVIQAMVAGVKTMTAPQVIQLVLAVAAAAVQEEPALLAQVLVVV